MDENKFYNIYPQLAEFKNNITILWEEPNKTDTRKVWSQQFKETTNIYTKKFIVIQNGCDSHCSFCLTIQKRWKSVNIPAQEIIQEINDFVETGWKEIVITGINLAARWCTDTKKPQDSKFSQLLKQILIETKIERIRISSLWPEFLDAEFFKVIKDTRFLPHFHISIQSFSNKILKSMNRHYNSELVNKIITKLKNLDRPDKNQISIWADIIVWFPWETEQDFQDTIDWITKYQINKLHIFPFSAHNEWESIPAHSFKNQIPQNIKKERAHKLTEIWDKIREQFIKNNKWIKHEVLIEEQKNWKRRWRTWNYIQVKIEWDYKKWKITKTIL
jgi:MiaB/RimO family radical SAM methylthiotransferase